MSELDSITTQHCNGCDQDKPLSEFHNDKNRPNGRTSQCMECNNARSKAYADSKRAEDPDWNKAYLLEYQANHREQFAGYQRTWVSKNPEKAKELTDQWRSEHPDEIRLYAGLRRARKYGVEYEPVSYDMLFAMAGGVCQECFRPVDPTLPYVNPETGSPDRNYGTTGHIIGLGQGGPHTYANTQLEHLGCNLDKERARHATDDEIGAIFYADHSASVRAFWNEETG